MSVDTNAKVSLRRDGQMSYVLTIETVFGDKFEVPIPSGTAEEMINDGGLPLDEQKVRR